MQYKVIFLDVEFRFLTARHSLTRSAHQRLPVNYAKQTE